MPNSGGLIDSGACLEKCIHSHVTVYQGTQEESVPKDACSMQHHTQLEGFKAPDSGGQARGRNHNHE